MQRTSPISKNSDITNFLMYGVFFSCAFRDLRFVSFLAPQDLFLLAAFIPLYAELSPGVKKRKLNFLLILGLFFFLIFALVSFVVSKNPADSVFNFLKVYVAFGILPAAIWIFVKRIEDVYLLFWAYVLGVLASCAFSQFLHLGSGSGRSSGLSGHAVFFGMLTSTAIVICLALDYRTFWTGLLGLIIIGFASVSLALSASSTGLVNVALSLPVILIMNALSRNFLRTLIFWIIPIVLGIISWNSNVFAFTKSRFLLSLNPQTGFSTNNIAGTSTIDSRIYSVKFGWERIKDSIIFGHGLDAAGRVTSIDLEPHNFFILAWQTGGLLFLALSLYFLYISLKYILGFIRYRFTLGIVVSLVTWIGLMTEPLIYERSVLAPFFLVCISAHIDRKKANEF